MARGGRSTGAAVLADVARDSIYIWARYDPGARGRFPGFVARTGLLGGQPVSEESSKT
jgi:hypothetical protein